MAHVRWFATARSSSPAPTCRHSCRQQDYVVADSDLMRQLEMKDLEEAEANGKRRRDRP
jgi:hypothetical protein